MMVIRAGKLTPASRGNSPIKEALPKNTKLNLNLTTAFRNPSRQRQCTPESGPPRSRGNSPSSIDSRVLYLSSRGSEQQLNRLKLLIDENLLDDIPNINQNSPMYSGRGGIKSLVGSVERLDETNRSQRIITSYNQVEDNINVVLRVRPLNLKEIKANDYPVVQFPGNGQVLVDHIPNGGSAQKSKLFSYNVVFEPAATQEDVLQFSGIKRLIEMAVEGFRCTAFCYGQTGSGKTHTLTGPPKLFDKNKSPYSDAHGLVFRSFLYLFKLLEEKSDVNFILKASFLEIYNEKVIDLLNPGSARKPLAVRWSKKARGFFVENLFMVDCEELDDLSAVLEEGMRNRSVGSHNMNEYSSRSHTILTVYITSEQPAEKGVFISRSGKINFVDLAGSEMTKKTQSEGKTLEEANNINRSLMVLGYCIASLSDNKRRNNHIPYRDSQLTKLLADSLAGNGVTLMIACISPALSNLSETINTLRYAARAKRIRTKPVVLMDPRESLIITLKREVNVLQSENEHLRAALQLQAQSMDESMVNGSKRSVTSPPHVDLETLRDLEGPQLVELVKLYVDENEALRKENAELFITREILLRDQELVCRDNEKLLKKLEDVNSVCCRSPLIQTKGTPTASSLGKSYLDLDFASTNTWTNTLDNTSKMILPEILQKELDKRRIGTPLSNDQRQHNSLDDLTRNKAKSANEDEHQNNVVPTRNRRFSMSKYERCNTLITLADSTNINSSNSTQAKNGLLERRPNQDKNRINGFHGEVFGSTVSLNDIDNHHHK